jgi:hypothetical protein
VGSPLRRAQVKRAAKNWFMVIVGGLFAAFGLFQAIGMGKRAGFTPLAFFGACALVGVRGIRRERSIRAHGRALAVEIPEYIPLQHNPTDGLVFMIGGIVVGSVVALTGGEMGTLLQVLGGVIAAGSGAALLTFAVLSRSGKLKKVFLQFEPTGLRIGQRRYQCVAEWGNLAHVAPGELGGHDLLLIVVRDLAHLAATVTPPGEAPRLLKAAASNRGWYGADLVLMPVQFGTDVAVLAKAMTRYWTPPSEREAPPTPPRQLPGDGSTRR